MRGSLPNKRGKIRQTAVLLQPVDHPLHAFAGAIDGPSKGTGPAFVGLPRDGDPDAVLSTKAPDRAAAVALVAHHPPGIPLMPSVSCPLHGPLGHQERKHRGLMAVARRQDERQKLAVPFRPHVDLRTEATLAAAERFGVCIAGEGACRMLMRPDDGPIDIVRVPIELARAIGLLLDGRQKTRPEARLAPAIHTAGDGAPGAIPLRQVTPGGAGTQQPEDAVEDAAMGDSWAAYFWLLRRKQGLSSFPLTLGEFMSVHMTKYTTRNRVCKHALAYGYSNSSPSASGGNVTLCWPPGSSRQVLLRFSAPDRGLACRPANTG